MAKTFGRFRVLIGVHSEGGKTYGKDEMAGDVIDSKSDLSKHNSFGAIKFARITDDGHSIVDVTPAPDQDESGNPNFDKMTVLQLKEFATENDLEISEASSKAELLVIVKEAWGDVDGD